MPKEYDFCGWATKNNILCSDGRTIRENAFKGNDKKRVPLVWNHQHNDAYNVLGHADLENRKEGVYAYCSFNNTESGNVGRELVNNGDVNALSIYANGLRQIGNDVVHGVIREVSLVLGGANPQALIDTVISHSDEDGESAYISFIDDGIFISHSDDDGGSVDDPIDEENEEMHNQNQDLSHADGNGSEDETVQDVINSMNEKQKNVLYYLVGEASKADVDDDEMAQSAIGYDPDEGDEMYHNVFEGDDNNADNILSHSDMEAILNDAKKGGMLSDAFIAHGVDIDNIMCLAHADGSATAPSYGIENIGMLFPEYKNLNVPPEFIKRDTGWVSIIMNGVHKSPFSRIKSMFADLREDEARALGYMKGKLKKEEVFSLLKRTTDPQTIYKKQKLDRDDVIDITDFDVISWIKGEMRIMLDEEIARAILVGDGRLSSSDDKIQETHIRPIWKDAALYNTVVNLDSSATTDDAKAKNFIKQVIKSRKNYKGSGSPKLFTTEDMLSDLLLIEDNNGRRLYETEDSLRSALRVSEIVTVPIMEGVKDDDGTALLGIIVNLSDYNVGADKGGAVSMFDDFDIDYNQMKYLIETRCSGALTKPFSAITIMAAKTTGGGGGTVTQPQG